MRAAVLHAFNEPLVIEEVQLDPPKAHEVLVKVAAAGVCHSDLHTSRGELRATPPIILGHEGAGIVEAIGPGVTRVKPGDHVIFCWTPPCGECAYCIAGRPTLCDGLDKTTYQGTLLDGTSRLHLGDITLHHYLGTSCFAEYVVIAESGAIPIPVEAPLDKASIVGCAVMTGLGAVTNTARVEPGSRVAIFGCGGVGLNAVQGAALAGCERIIAIDLVPAKLEMARTMGATHTVKAGEEQTLDQIRALTGGRGVDYAFDSVGLPSTIKEAIAATKKGGTIVIIGLGAMRREVSMTFGPLVTQEKRILGSFYGSSRPALDLPRLIDLYLAHKIKLDELVTQTYRLDQVNEAFADMEAGKLARGVILF